MITSHEQSVVQDVLGLHVVLGVSSLGVGLYLADVCIDYDLSYVLLRPNICSIGNLGDMKLPIIRS